MRSILFLGIILFVISCSNHKEQNNEPAAPVAKTDTLPYYYVRATILQEIENIKNTPNILIYKLTEQLGKKDSAVIDTTQLINLAKPFYETDLNDPSIKKEYKESVFADNITKSFVLDYKTSNPALPVKSISVMLDTEQQDFKRLDLVKIYHQKDTLYEERLAWIAGKKFQIIQLATAGNTELTKKTYVIWQERK